MFRSLHESPPHGVVAAKGFGTGGELSADICIVTNCAFVGGNASTTITELEAFAAAGLRCLIIHCPVKRSFWKRRWIAERFLPFLEFVVPSNEVKQLRCRTLIVRGPRMMMTKTFRRLIEKVSAERALYVINNSSMNEDGSTLFSWTALRDRVAETGLPQSKIYPISPLIRAEAKKFLENQTGSELLASYDWPPAFKIDDFPFKPKKSFGYPIVIGRHSRDHEGKWLENPEELQAAYPNSPDIIVSILGGADIPRKRLGFLPSNWVVRPFGGSAISHYLAELEVFVNFPATTRDEAFGRTIIEAILCGVPVVLPTKFRQTFGDLALYCEPHEVRDVVARLAICDRERLHYLQACRELAAERFGSHTLHKRVQPESSALTNPPSLDERARAFREEVMP